MEEKNWLEEGNKFYYSGEFEKAIECYDKAIEKDSEDTFAHNNKGVVLYYLGRYEEAIICCNEAIKLKIDNHLAWNNKGNALNELGKYEEAIINYDQAIELKKDYHMAWSNKGVALYNLEKYEQAIIYYNQAIELKKDYYMAWNNKGNALCRLGKHEEAIIYYDQAIELKKDYFEVWNNKGVALYSLKKYEEAIECYNEAIRLQKDYLLAYRNRGLAYINKQKYLKAADDFEEANMDVLDIFVRYGDNDDIEKTAFCMLDKDEFFTQTVESDLPPEAREQYKNIYIRSLKIILLLHINKEESEKDVAHYTRKKTSELFLFDPANISLRLYSIVTANDPSEGDALLDYLWTKETTAVLKKESEDYGAFIGCFTFNHCCLNQFRLYGKENHIEATGVSLTVGKNYFNSDVQRTTPTFDNSTENSKPEINKLPLFRCVYIDPQTKHVASVGHKEEYAFYRDNPNMKQKTVDDYKTYIETILKQVRNELKNLQKEIRKKGVDKKTVAKLLTNLRYLTKHVAFKEEQECRIFRVKSLTNDNEVKTTDDYSQMYIDYLPIRKYVQKVYFAPKTAGFELFRDITKNKNLNIECHRCDHPFA